MAALPAPLICPSCGAPNEGGLYVCQNCTFVLVALPQIHVGFVLASRYEITCALGAGGMGIVYQAQDRLLNETVALKVLRPEVAATPEMAQRFISEIKIARAVSHRNVCRIHEYGEDRGLRYISMAFVGGVDLRRVLRERGPLTPALAFEVAVQATEGLEAVHEEGIVHRDLKPANITVDPRGVVRVMDFGLAKQSSVSGDLSSGTTGQMVGTPEYMSPEQIRGAKLDPRSDVYAMGIVVYELFTGRTPFRADTPVVTILRHLNEPPPLDGVETLPAAVVPVLKKALQKEPEQRYSSAEELRHALEEARSSTTGAAETEADFASLFKRREPGDLTDAAQASQSSFSTTQGLSHATWTTAVGRAVVEAEAPGALEQQTPVRVEPIVEAEPVPALDGLESREHAVPLPATDIEEMGIGLPSPLLQEPETQEPETREPEAQDPVAAWLDSEIGSAPAPPGPWAEPAPTPAAPALGTPTPAASTRVRGTRVPGTATPATPVAMRPPDESARLTPAARRPDESAKITPLARRPDESARVTPLAKRPDESGRTTPLARRPDESSRLTPLVKRPGESGRTTPLARRPDESSRLTPLPRGSGGRSPRTAPSSPWQRLAELARDNPRYAIAAAAVALVVVITLGALYFVGAPHVASTEPARVPAGGTVVLTGTGFSEQADANQVLFSGQPGRVTEASSTRLAAELPDLDAAEPGPERSVPVVVRVGGRSSAAFDLTVYPFPWIRSLAPDVGMPGDKVTINGAGWPLTASVRFGKLDAQILERTHKSITVRVPALRLGVSGSVLVVVAAGQDVSNPLRFRVGRAQP